LKKHTPTRSFSREGFYMFFLTLSSNLVPTSSKLAAVCLVLCTGATLANAETKKGKELKSQKDKVSYILGHQIGSNFQRNNVEIDQTIFAQAVAEALKGDKSRVSQEESQTIMTAYQADLQKKKAEKDKAAGDVNTKEGKAFLDANGKKPGWKALPSGLQYKVEKEGAGASPKSSDTVKVHYRGTLLNGKEFDSSYARKEPAEFGVTQVIKGWTEALQLMKPGAKWQLAIPSDLAYGANGAGGDIGPNSTLLFDVELLEIKAAAAPAGTPAPKK
jgi:FKBP-type peptidyl-prolyl cis-trans isomerase FklB